MARVAEAQGLTAEELAEIAINGFRRGFGPPGLPASGRPAEADRAWGAWVNHQLTVTPSRASHLGRVGSDPVGPPLPLQGRRPSSHR